MKMDFSVLILALTMLCQIPLSSSIKCYKCDAERVYSDSRVPLCEHYDGSDRFIADCPSSTGCIKKETMLDRFGEKTRSIERGCAHQTMEGEQEKVNGHWAYVNKIHEVYTVGCKEDPAEYGKLTRATNCFCRGDLCNSAVQPCLCMLGLITMFISWLIVT